jgi:hypothetical protein
VDPASHVQHDKSTKIPFRKFSNGWVDHMRCFDIDTRCLPPTTGRVSIFCDWIHFTKFVLTPCSDSKFESDAEELSAGHGEETAGIRIKQGPKVVA